MDNIVVLIGSFNPITKAHFEALHTAKKYLNATKAIFVPTPEDYVKGKMTKANLHCDGLINLLIVDNDDIKLKENELMFMY